MSNIYQQQGVKQQHLQHANDNKSQSQSQSQSSEKFPATLTGSYLTDDFPKIPYYYPQQQWQNIQRQQYVQMQFDQSRQQQQQQQQQHVVRQCQEQVTALQQTTHPLPPTINQQGTNEISKQQQDLNRMHMQNQRQEQVQMQAQGLKTEGPKEGFTPQQRIELKKRYDSQKAAKAEAMKRTKLKDDNHHLPTTIPPLQYTSPNAHAQRVIPSNKPVVTPVVVTPKTASSYKQEKETFVPLRDLSCCKNWRIKVRIMTKSPSIRSYKKKKAGGGEGHVFNVEIQDSDNVTMGAVFWDALALEWFDKLHVGGVYTMCGTNPHDQSINPQTGKYEICFSNKSDNMLIVQVPDTLEISRLPQFSLKKLNELENLPPGKAIDIAGVIQKVSPLSQVNKRIGGVIDMREIELIDDTCSKVSVKLWDACAASAIFDTPHAVILLKHLVLKEYMGVVGITSTPTTQIFHQFAHFQIQRIAQLVAWRQKVLTSSPHRALPDGNFAKVGPPPCSLGKEPRLSIQQMHLDMERLKATKYYTLKATVTYKVSKDPPFYRSCDLCNKKLVTQTLPHEMICASCNRNQFQMQPVFKYQLHVTLLDATGSVDVSLFDREGELFMGLKAAEFQQLWFSNRQVAERHLREKMFFKMYYFKLRVTPLTPLSSAISTISSPPPPLAMKMGGGSDTAPPTSSTEKGGGITSPPSPSHAFKLSLVRVENCDFREEITMMLNRWK